LATKKSTLRGTRVETSASKSLSIGLKRKVEKAK